MFEVLASHDPRAGTTATDIIKLLGISTNIYYRWRKEHPDFSEAVKELQDKADDLVVNSLFGRAVGMTVTEEHRTEKEGGPGGKDNTTVGLEVTEKTIVKQIVPDVGAQMNWLKNRRPDEWRDKQEIAVTGTYSEMLAAFFREEQEKEAQMLADKRGA